MEKTCLIVIDGWGINVDENAKGDAIKNAKTPVMDKFEREYPFVKLAAHGLSVGLPDGLMGNSEVGHLNIGAGRIVFQDIVRIDEAVKKNVMLKQPDLLEAFEQAKKDGRLHLLGLVSDGGVHSHILHLFHLIKLAKEFGIKKTFIHFFGDGRDTAPRSAIEYLKQLKSKLQELNYGSVATVIGRYYVMDRDKRWERIKIAYDALVSGVGEESIDLEKTIQERYSKDETDEFLKPIIGDKEGIIKDGETIICFNYRSDRMREISQALGISPLPFDSKPLKNLNIVTMTRYKADFPFKNIFPVQSMDNVLAEWLDKKNVPQCHIAETEKYAHVTFFFNGGTETKFKLEDRDMIDSPKVATYDLKPEMSAIPVAEKVASRIGEETHPFIMCNFAPPDMVGHTGVYDAAVHAIEATDKAIGIIYDACVKHNYTLFVTADHGNAEKMLAEDGITPHTAHTCNKVPFVMTSKKVKFQKDEGSDVGLCDVAPTILDFMGIEIPKEMSGRSLLDKN
ncbi:hypothetical protein HK099_007643 [Clydaea vesicula]|uniref:2,3-bisphosphoglycerate-independent phosphoglycerate mutase n=1 Tax=Clydaea vesicula TaxID=447962 RepID=A0AAD5XXV1_9FUNG|nr:hypothetical protein HK099_007643 [Clydaea vesicula]KAJ3394789.1 hypothetical protein HDU92_006578 [Lobulomyces angularis]